MNTQNSASENREYEYRGSLVNGFMMIAIVFVLIPLLIVLAIAKGGEENLWLSVGVSVPLFIVFLFGCAGYFTQEPNESRVMIFFGKYRGTCCKVGYFWVNPFMTRRKLSLRIRNMDIEPIKVNDKTGNPVLIGMVLVWRIKDTYKAVFDIDSASLADGTSSVSASALERFVRIQSDAALREVTGHYAYDNMGSDGSEMTLRDGGSEINELLENKINERLEMAGMEVVEARLNYLAYAPEIAAVMLRRQQASAIISAREKIVEGAVTMVEMAVDKLEKGNVVKLSDEHKAAMVSNMMVVLCADESAQPVVSAGS